MNRCGLRFVMVLIASATATMIVLSAEPPPSPRPTHVLILTPHDAFRPLVHDLIVSFRSALALKHTNTIQFYTESLDFNRVPTAEDEAEMAQHYRAKYSDREMDLIATRLPTELLPHP